MYFFFWGTQLNSLNNGFNTFPRKTNSQFAYDISARGCGNRNRLTSVNFFALIIVIIGVEWIRFVRGGDRNLFYKHLLFRRDALERFIIGFEIRISSRRVIANHSLDEWNKQDTHR